MSFERLITEMSEEVYQRLATAVETGRWPDGTVLAPEQRSQSQQLVMAWQAHHLSQPQHMQINRNGEIAHWSKQQLKSQFQGDAIPTISVDSSDE